MQKFADEFKKKNLPLHMLFNNAGEWIREDDTYTEDGFQVRQAEKHDDTSVPCCACPPLHLHLCCCRTVLIEISILLCRSWWEYSTSHISFSPCYWLTSSRTVLPRASFLPPAHPRQLPRRRSLGTTLGKPLQILPSRSYVFECCSSRSTI